MQAITGCISKSELAQSYGITTFMLCLWLKKVPGYIPSRNKLLKPNELKLIFNHIGDPEYIINKKISNQKQKEDNTQMSLNL